MVKSKVALVLGLGLLSSCVGAENPIEEHIRKAMQPRLTEGTKIDSVKRTPYAGLYEVVAGGTILYTDAKAEFIVQGQVFNAKTSENLTAKRSDEVNMIKFNELPFELALKTVKGNGKRVFALFEDPNCGYCKRFRQTTLAEIDNVTVYTFLYNVVTESSAAKSRDVWCSADRNKAWDEWMLSNRQPAPAAADCQDPNDKILALGRRYNINGTPAIIFTDGSRLPGAADLKTMEAKLASIKTK